MNNRQHEYTFTKIDVILETPSSSSSPQLVGALLNGETFIGGFLIIDIDYNCRELTVHPTNDRIVDPLIYSASIDKLEINGEDASTMTLTELIAALKTFTAEAEGPLASGIHTKHFEDIAAGGGIRITYSKDHNVYTIHSSDHLKVKELEKQVSFFKIKDIKTGEGGPVTEQNPSGSYPGIILGYDADEFVEWIGVDTSQISSDFSRLTGDPNNSTILSNWAIHSSVEPVDDNYGIIGGESSKSIRIHSEDSDAATFGEYVNIYGKGIEILDYTYRYASISKDGLDVMASSTPIQTQIRNNSISILSGDTVVKQLTSSFSALIDSYVLSVGDLSSDFSIADNKVEIDPSYINTAITSYVDTTVATIKKAQLQWLNTAGVYTPYEGVGTDSSPAANTILADTTWDRTKATDFIFIVYKSGHTDTNPPYDQYVAAKNNPTAADFRRIGDTQLDLTNYYEKSETYSKTQVDTKLVFDSIKTLTGGTNVTVTKSGTGHDITYSISALDTKSVVKNVVNVCTSLPLAANYNIGTLMCLVDEYGKVYGSNNAKNNSDNWMIFGDPYYEPMLCKHGSKVSQRWSAIFPWDTSSAPQDWMRSRIKNIWTTIVTPINPWVSSSSKTNTLRPRVKNPSQWNPFKDMSGDPVNLPEFNYGTRPNKNYTSSEGIKFAARKFQRVGNNKGWNFYGGARIADYVWEVVPTSDPIIYQIGTLPNVATNQTELDIKFDGVIDASYKYSRCDDDATSGAWTKAIEVHQVMDSGWDETYFIELENGKFFEYTDIRGGGGARWADDDPSTRYTISHSYDPLAFYRCTEGSSGAKEWTAYSYGASGTPINNGDFVFGVFIDGTGIICMTWDSTQTPGQTGTWNVQASLYNKGIKKLIAGSNVTVQETPAGSGEWTIAATGGSGGGGTWGSITGELSDQEDLQDELDTKIQFNEQYDKVIFINGSNPMSSNTKPHINFFNDLYPNATDRLLAGFIDRDSSGAGVYVEHNTGGDTWIKRELSAYTFGEGGVYGGSGIQVPSWSDFDSNYFELSSNKIITKQSTISHDTTLTGSGTTASPLAVASPFNSANYYLKAETFQVGASYIGANLDKKFGLQNSQQLYSIALCDAYGTARAIEIYQSNATGNPSGITFFHVDVVNDGNNKICQMEMKVGDTPSSKYFNVNKSSLSYGQLILNENTVVTHDGTILNAGKLSTDFSYVTSSPYSKLNINANIWKVKNLVAGAGGNISLSYDAPTGTYTIDEIDAGLTEIHVGAGLTGDGETTATSLAVDTSTIATKTYVDSRVPTATTLVHAGTGIGITAPDANGNITISSTGSSSVTADSILACIDTTSGISIVKDATNGKLDFTVTGGGGGGGLTAVAVDGTTIGGDGTTGSPIQVNPSYVAGFLLPYAKSIDVYGKTQADAKFATIEALDTHATSNLINSLTVDTTKPGIVLTNPTSPKDWKIGLNLDAANIYWRDLKFGSGGGQNDRTINDVFNHYASWTDTTSNISYMLSEFYGNPDGDIIEWADETKPYLEIDWKYGYASNSMPGADYPQRVTGLNIKSRTYSDEYGWGAGMEIVTKELTGSTIAISTDVNDNNRVTTIKQYIDANAPVINISPGNYELDDVFTLQKDTSTSQFEFWVKPLWIDPIQYDSVWHIRTGTSYLWAIYLTTQDPQKFINFVDLTTGEIWKYAYLNETTNKWVRTGDSAPPDFDPADKFNVSINSSTGVIGVLIYGVNWKVFEAIRNNDYTFPPLWAYHTEMDSYSINFEDSLELILNRISTEISDKIGWGSNNGQGGNLEYYLTDADFGDSIYLISTIKVPNAPYYPGTTAYMYCQKGETFFTRVNNSHNKVELYSISSYLLNTSHTPISVTSFNICNYGLFTDVTNSNTTYNRAVTMSTLYNFRDTLGGYILKLDDLHPDDFDITSTSNTKIRSKGSFNGISHSNRFTGDGKSTELGLNLQKYMKRLPCPADDNGDTYIPGPNGTPGIADPVFVNVELFVTLDNGTPVTDTTVSEVYLKEFKYFIEKLWQNTGGSNYQFNGYRVHWETPWYNYDYSVVMDITIYYWPNLPTDNSGVYPPYYF